MKPLNFPFVLLCMKIATDKIDGNRISLFCEFYFRNRMPATMAISCEKKIDVISTEHHSPSRKYIVFSYFIIIIMENHHFSEHQTVEAARTAEHSAVLCCAVSVGSMSERIAVRQCLACSSFFPSHFLHSHSLRTSYKHTQHTLYLSLPLIPCVYFPFVIRWCVFVFIVAIVVVLTAAFMSLSLSSILLRFLSFMLTFASLSGSNYRHITAHDVSEL